MTLEGRRSHAVAGKGNSLDRELQGTGGLFGGPGEPDEYLNLQPAALALTGCTGCCFGRGSAAHWTALDRRQRLTAREILLPDLTETLILNCPYRLQTCQQNTEIKW